MGNWLVWGLAGILAAGTAVDVTNREQLRVLTDGHDHYIAVGEPGTDTWGTLYYGDGKTFYDVYVRGSSSDSGRGMWDLIFVDGRYHISQTGVTRHVKDGQEVVTVQCGKMKTPMEPVTDTKRKSILEKASFERSPHDYYPYSLSRDDKGTYYYVERGRWPDNKKSFRVFIGQRGKMKQAKLTNVVNDSEGSIFATTSGTLRLVLHNEEHWWIEEDDREKLVIVPTDQNRELIYNDLGVYMGLRMGTPCDDL